MSDPLDIPQGFKALQRFNSPFLSSLGQLYARKDGENLIIALRIEQKHLNTRGLAHGGMLVTLADSALGIVIASMRTPPKPMVTINLTTDFADAAREGDWVEARVDVQKFGRRLAFASCHLWVGERRILRASGIFAHVAPAEREGSFEG
ncbi:MAG TPA: PaaI family thioesterase [Myxococcales bacterium]